MARPLSEYCGGRDNNFNLIRMVAASAVLVSHAFPIALGRGAEEPLEALLGQSLGSVAVAVFFAISGFLIARSFDRADRVADWVAARVMRLFPALVVVVLLTALVYGPLTTTLPAGAYFTDPEVATYVVRNITLARLQYDLPGVFDANPYPEAINGSLWTLFYEVLCYLGVLLIGLLGLLRRPRLLAGVLAAYFVLCLAAFLPAVEEALPSRARPLRNLSLPFAIGTALYVWRERIPLGWAGLVVLALPALALHGTVWFRPAFVLWLSYAVFALAYLPGGALRRYNRLGDYSYGVYIYAFPMQQLAVFLAGAAGMSAWLNMAVAFPATLALAVLSWHWVEKPGLASRHRVADWLAAGRPGRPARRPGGGR